MSNIIRARGLHTYQSEINASEGSLEVADNVVINADNTIEPRRGFNDYGNVTGDSSDIKQLLQYKDRILRHYSDKLEFDNGSGTFTAFSGSYNELKDGLRIKYQEANSNLFFTTSTGIKKISATNSNQFTSAASYITDAGGVKAIDLEANIDLTDNGFIPAQSKVAYRLVWGIKDSNNNLILGSPSSRVVIENNSDDISIQEKVDITVNTDEVGLAPAPQPKYFLLESFTTSYFVWYQTGSDAEPSSASTLGRTGIEVDISAITPGSKTEIANLTANKIDDLQEFTISVDTVPADPIITLVSNTGGGVPNSADIDTGFVFTIQTEGEIASGKTANATITSTVPRRIIDENNLNYFYQLFRTPVVTATTGLTLNDIDPGDDMNLVFEQTIAAEDITNKFVTIPDIVTEDFRVGGDFLYTNPITGAGILQANGVPPIAQDIALFRESTFYANTKNKHQLTIDMLPVTSYTTGTSKFIIANDDGFREYLFEGVAQQDKITTDTFANTLAESWILLNSARDERKYFIWFYKSVSDELPVDSELDDRIGIRVDISSDTTAEEVRDSIITALLEVPDFNPSAGAFNEVLIEAWKAGVTTGVALGSTPPGGGDWDADTPIVGLGENAAIQQVLLSTILSPSQRLEETARSLVKVINKDPLSDVVATYLSGPDDLPGKILLENISLEDKPFFLAVNDENIIDSFNPSLPFTRTIASATIAADSTITTTVDHDYILNDLVYVQMTTNSEVVQGSGNITGTPNTDEFQIGSAVTDNTGIGSNDFTFKITVQSDNLIKPNRIYYSKIGQPEAVPIVNFIDVGTQDKEIERIVALRDNLYVFKEDGVYIVTGPTAPNFNVRLLDNSTNIIAPDSAAVLNNQIYCLTTQGIATVTDAGVGVISRPIEGDITAVTNNKFNFKNTSFGIGYESDRAYMLWLPTKTTDTIATQCYRFNTFTRSWTRFTISSTSAVLNSNDDKLYLSAGGRGIVSQERKEFDRTDFADRDFIRALPFSKTDIEAKEVELSSVVDMDIGDVIVQQQYVSIVKFNRLLKKLDNDSETQGGYLASEEAFVGDTMSTKLTDLVTRLNTDPKLFTFTAPSGVNDIISIRDDANLLIAELNNASSGTVFKNYREFEDLNIYEVFINAININTNVITANIRGLFLQGDVTVYKGIGANVRWLPHHAGDPSSTKRFRYGKIFFDQNNFNTATVAFNSDLSANFDAVNFTAGTTGLWGGFNWGKVVWGGSGDDRPLRTLIPQQKQYCRYITMDFKHVNARETFKILGISFDFREIGDRGYR